MMTKEERRQWRKKRIRKKVAGSPVRPRLTVFRSATHIYAQVVDDETSRTLIAASSLEKDIREADKGNKTDVAKKVGALVARKCLENNIKKVVFDRNGFVYHGRIRALAEGARESGLEF
ncbi:MAG: 50S ribosomal protein L18 [Myxococcota bacterium]|jgi:large subunit ribosomal protein L18|nr:50S ribosomal protein L18 [Myxococcota bacterium]